MRLRLQNANVKMLRGLFLGFVASAVCAATIVLAAPEGEAAGDSNLKKFEAYGLQLLDDPSGLLVPLEPRSAAKQMHVNALAHYMAGQLREKKGDLDGALKAYRKAVELDPESIAIYRRLIPLAFMLEQTADAVKYAEKAVELSPDDYGLLYRFGVHLAGQGKIPEAIRLFELAAESKTLKENTNAHIRLMGFLAYIYGETGQKEKAADAYKVVFDALKDPRKYNLNFRTQAELQADRKTSYERIGKAFLDVNRIELAVEAFEQAEKTGRGNPGNLSFNLARVYLQTKKYDDALAHLQKYFDLQLQSKGRSAYELLAEILKQTEKSEQLIEKLEQLASRDRRNNTLQYFLAGQYLKADRLEEAEELYKRVLSDSSDPEGYAGLAAVYRRQGRPEELLDALARAVKGNGNLQQLGRNLQHISAEIEAIAKDEQLLDSLIEAGRKLSGENPPKLSFASSWILARLAADAKKSDAAIEFYRFALAAESDRAPLLYEELGLHLLSVDKYSEAVEIYQEAVKRSSNNPRARGAKAMFLYRISQAQEFAGQTEPALEAIGEARKIDPKNPLYHFQEGWVHYHSRNWDDAIRVFEQVVAENSGNKAIVRRCQFSLSNIYVQQGNMRKGEEVLEQVLAEDPDNPSVNNDLGYLYADQGKNLEQAEMMIRKAVDAKPDEPAYLDSLGWVLYKLGKFEEAVTFLEKAVSLPSGSDATIWDHLADCYQRLGKDPKAAEAWQKALELAREQQRPDQKLIDRIEEKLANKQQDADALKPERANSP